MSRNILVINVDLRETRVSLIEDGVIAELQLERASARGTVGNVVLGKVTRVLPGMQAAFIDVGQERAAFLHVEDLIRPDDFDAYLADAARDELPGVADAREDRDDTSDASGEASADQNESLPPGNAEDTESLPPEEIEAADNDETQPPTAADDDDDLLVAVDDDAAAGPDDGDDDEAAEPTDEEDAVDEAGADSQAPDSLAPEANADGGDAAQKDGGEDGEEEDDEAAAWAALDADATVDPKAAEAAVAAAVAARAAKTDAKGETESSSADAAPAADEDPDAAKSDSEARGRRSRRRRPRRKRGAGKADAGEASATKKQTVKNVAAPGRVSRSVPITEVVKEGDHVLVQISKEPIGTKGARVTSHISLAGRYVVYLPTVDHAGISKRIGSSRERMRLRKAIDSVKPPKGGLIVRTVAEGLTKKQLKADVGYLMRLWADIAKHRKGAKAPSIVSRELDLVLKVARDLFTDEIEKIVIDDRDEYARLVRFVEAFLPHRVKDIELYTGAEPIFDAYGIEDEIARALSRKVPLPSGGYLVLDQAEALTAIDVNTGRFVGKGSKDLEETALKTNVEAVEEIAYQLRFRNIGGLVILDLIDMDNARNREKVWRALEIKLEKDKAKTTLNRISDLGLIEMTRKRTRESLGRTMHEPCFYCDGTGQIQSRATIAYEILRQMRRELQSLAGYSVVVNAHPSIVDFLEVEEKEAVADAERRFMRRIELVAHREYHIEQFDLKGK